jgi:hypothetical protein
MRVYKEKCWDGISSNTETLLSTNKETVSIALYDEETIIDILHDPDTNELTLLILDEWSGCSYEQSRRLSTDWSINFCMLDDEFNGEYICLLDSIVCYIKPE